MASRGTRCLAARESRRSTAGFLGQVAPPVPAQDTALPDAELKHAEPASTPDTIDVVFSRETATVSMPTAEAAIQHSLAAMMRRALGRDEPGQLDRSTEAPIALIEIESLQPGSPPDARAARRSKLEPQET